MAKGRLATVRSPSAKRCGLEGERVKRGVILVALGVLVGGWVAPARAQELPPGGTFVDDDGNVHEGFIEAIATEGITKGCNPPVNDHYCPNDAVTRGQMAAFLRRAFELPAANDDFFDDDEGSVFEEDINALAAAGITKGCNPPVNDLFCPADHVTRGEMAAFLVRAFEYKDDGGGNLFVDDDGSVFEGDIDRLATAGVTKGCNPPQNDEYCPNDLVKRDQMASFLGRAKGLTPTVPPELVSFGDGTWQVEQEVPAGTYRNDDSSGGCYWERLSGFSGEFDDIIANDFIDYLTVVTILSSDAGFSAERCGTWSNRLTSITASLTNPFGDGVWIVGTDVGSGTWRNEDSSGGCYWERLSGFTGEFDDIIANNFAYAIQTVEIEPDDEGFRSNGCGEWTRLSG
ncbi:MAG: S-layer homology domain-containing protein [Acidimicrobiia bacterium]